MSNERTGHVELAPELASLTRLVQGSLGQLTSEQSLRGELLVSDRLVNAPPPQKSRRLVGAGALVAASVLVLVVALRHHTETSVLSYVIENKSSPDDRSLDVGTGLPQTVRFSDGTEVRVDQGTRAQIRFVTDHGAELAMARGALHASVVHSATSEWRFDAGPFVVHVTGTAFGLSWDPELDRFDLRLEHGSVTVSSPVVNDPIPVRAGQWLTIRPRSNEVFIRDLSAAATNDEPEPDSGSPSVERDSVRPPSPTRSFPAHAPESARVIPEPKPAAAAGHNWAQDLLHGKADQVVDDALRRGLDGCLAESSGSELAALADAARYTRRNDVARRVLLAERRRFAGSRTAADAALFLGRLAEAEQSDGQALTWFDTYLAEAPAGPHASEALGRKLAIVRHSGGAAAARSIAEEYLTKYPDGTYSSAARAILKTP
jgi:hypothetical protein